VDDFPVVVRLHKDFFHFSQAKANGEDIRYSTADGKPLAYIAARLCPQLRITAGLQYSEANLPTSSKDHHPCLRRLI